LVVDTPFTISTTTGVQAIDNTPWARCIASRWVREYQSDQIRARVLGKREVLKGVVPGPHIHRLDLHGHFAHRLVWCLAPFPSPVPQSGPSHHELFPRSSHVDVHFVTTSWMQQHVPVTLRDMGTRHSNARIRTPKAHLPCALPFP
jgi:hypothetical protein